MQKNAYTWGIVLVFIAAMFFPRLVVEGMFGDGLSYAAIARNMAVGKGNFWAPFFSSTYWLTYNQGEVFYEHPPLMMWVQSFFFLLLGDHWMVEKVFCVFVLILSLFLIRWLWDSFNLDTQMGWLPMLLWYSMPTVIWAYPNNLLDAFMAIFCMLSVGVQVRGLRQGKSIFVSQALAGLFMLLAFLTKGPVGLFPLATPALLFLTFQEGKIKKVLTTTLISALTLLASFFILFQFPPAHAFLTTYLNQQVLGAVSGTREVTIGSHWWDQLSILFYLLIELAPALGFLLLVLVAHWLKRKKDSLSLSFSSPALFLFLTGLSASLPILVSPKQKALYLLPALPFFALGLAATGFPWVKSLSGSFSLSKRTLVFLFWSLLLGTLLYSTLEVGKVGRDQDLILDMKQFSPWIPEASKVVACENMMVDMAVHVYLQRYYGYEVIRDFSGTPYALSRESCEQAYRSQLIENGFQEIKLPMRTYQLWVRQ